MVDETLILVSFTSTAIAVAILVAFVYYKLKWKRLNLIEKGLWKSEYDTNRLETIVVEAAILMAIGAAALLTGLAIKESELYLRTLVGLISLFVGIALLMCFLTRFRMASSERKKD